MRDRSMSNNTVNAALRRLGRDKNQITGHGFRGMASALLNDSFLMWMEASAEFITPLSTWKNGDG
jgi:hypothetical protein